jgi:stage V sporulation protein B
MYSAYGNLAVPLYNLIPSLLSPITLALMPLLGGFAGRGEFARAKETLCTAVRITTLFAIPASLGLCIFARPLLFMIFAGQSEAIAVAAPLLSLLALSVVPSALLTLMGAALQATGHTLLPVIAMSAGAAVKLSLECILLPLPQCGIMGAPVSTLACTLTVLLIEWVALARHLPFVPVSPQQILRPLFCALPGLLAGGVLYFLACRALACEPRWLMPLVLLTVGVLVLPAALFGRALEREDLLALPAGEGICRILEKCKLLK